MADRPILFSGPMIRALHAGHKTQTRRLFKPRGFEFYTHPVSGDRYNEYRPYRDGTWDESRISGGGPMRPFGWGESLYAYLSHAPGDRLYVREHWRTHAMFDDIAPRDLQARSIHYCADGEINSGKHRQAMHMPRWASRLTLTVTDVRVERLQDISDEDAVAEGAHGIWDGTPFTPDPTATNKFTVDIGGGNLSAPTAVGVYRMLWEWINGDGSWDANPWVVAYSFSVERQNIDLIERAA